MSFVHIKKIQQGTREVYAVPSVAIVTPQGKKLIPNPSGQEAVLFDTLEEAQQAVRLAGFDYIFEGRKTYTIKPEGGPPVAVVHKGATLADAVPALIEHLNDREPAVVANAVFALGGLRASQALEPLSQCLGHDDPNVRKQVAEAMARMGAAALSWLRDAYEAAKSSKHKNAPYIRLTVMSAYLEIAQAAPHLLDHVLPQVMDGLNDESWLVRSQAALVVGNGALARESAEAPD